MSRLSLTVEGVNALVGTHDENLRRIERAFEVEVNARGAAVTVDGGPEGVATAAHLLEGLSTLIASGHQLRQHEIQTAIRVLQEEPTTDLVRFFSGDGLLAKVRGVASPRSLNQQRYLEAMLSHDLVVSIGPAGTGKTYLAVAMAAAAMAEKQVRRLILCRPAVEAGERLGFLPGDLAEKVNPYLRPMYDALYDLIGYDKVSRMMERGTIEVAPLAFMRGRSLNDSFIILDEAQNTTSEQMKMFLTRIGFNSRAVVTGDVTQIDLPSDRPSGLNEARRILADVEGVAFVRFTDRDVVRHPLVKKIVAAYERDEARDDSARKSIIDGVVR